MVKTIFKKISYFNNFLTTLVLLLHRARLSCRKTNTKVITTANHINGKHHRLPMRTQVKTSKLPKARENAGGQATISIRFVSLCLRGWREFSRKITEQGKAETSKPG